MSTSSEDENEDCPICVEPFDGDDRQFQACDCLYHVCMFCVRRLMTEFEGKCPGCRKPYNEANFKMRELLPEQIERRRARLERQKALERNARRQPQQQGSLLTSNNMSGVNLARSTSGRAGGGGGISLASANSSSNGGAGGMKKNAVDAATLENENALAQQRKSLANVKVLQPNAVFVVGLVQHIAREDVLRRHEYFGQFGQIIKIVIGHPPPVPGRAVTLSAHITYVKMEDALHAIQTLNGTMMEGHPIRLSSGTTRYCHSFLRGQQCNMVDCTYLHHEVEASSTANARGGAVAAPSLAPTPPPNLSQQQMFGGTDPFDLTSSPSPQPHLPPALLPSSSTGGAPRPPALAVVVDALGGVELAQFQRQRNRGVLTQSRAIGEGSAASPQPPLALDASLGHLADLLLLRTGEEMKRHFSGVFHPRPIAFGYSGLDSVFQLHGTRPRPPYFVAAPSTLLDK